MADEEEKKPDRLPDGRFLPGHKIGGGGFPAGKYGMASRRRKVQEAFSAEHCILILKEFWMLGMGIDPHDPNPDFSKKKKIAPDISAGRVFLEYMLGRPHPIDEDDTKSVVTLISLEDAIKNIEQADAILKKAKELGIETFTLTDVPALPDRPKK